MATRDDAGSNYGRPGGSQNSGTYNGGVAGGGGGGFAGGGGGRNGGFNSSTGLRTGTNWNGNTASGPAGGMATSYTTRRSGDMPNRPTTGNLMGGVSLGGLAKSLADIFTRPTQQPGLPPYVAPNPSIEEPPLPPYEEVVVPAAAPLPQYEEVVVPAAAPPPRQTSWSPGMWWNNPTSQRSQQFNPSRFPNSLDGAWRASGGWPGQAGVPSAGNTVYRVPGDVRYPGGQMVRKNGNGLPAPTGKEEIN